jgi:hypothetical protein
MVKPTDKLSAINSPTKRLISLLNEYKELITTVVFFVGGILWVFGYFATKEELRQFRETSSTQHKILNCLLEQHVRLLGAKQILSSLRDDLTGLEEELRKQAPSGPQILQTDLRKIIKLEQRRNEINATLAVAEKDIAEAGNAITYRSCEK